MSMIDSDEIRTLGRFLDVSAFRAGLISSNLANIDTPGYRARDINFQQELERADAPIELDNFVPVALEVRGLAARPDGNDVSLEREGLLLAETQLRFQLGAQVLKSEFHQIAGAINEGSST